VTDDQRQVGVVGDHVTEPSLGDLQVDEGGDLVAEVGQYLAGGFAR